MNAVEANFDGLVGPTHNYAGLAAGNLASALNAAQASNPRAAALQGLAKMQALSELGLAQGFLPPQERPHLPTLRRLGFSGSDAQVLQRVRRDTPGLLAAVSSASAMWAANAATVSPSADSADGRVHFTPANLCTHLHRAIETDATSRLLQRIFPGPQHFAHHAALPGTPELGDEGAANHTRLCADYGEPGIQLFVYGRGEDARSLRFPARQTRSASAAVARLHALSPPRLHFTGQSARAIDAGVFHNDVIAVGNRELLLYHAAAFEDADGLRDWIEAQLPTAVLVEIAEDELGLDEAVSSYLFNSQLVCPPHGGMRMIVAEECREQPRVWQCIQRLLADARNPLDGVDVFDLRQSMRNGGGPACLRLRVVLTAAERAAVHPGAWITPQRHAQLTQWVQRHYRDRLQFDDLADPQLLDEVRTALDALTRLLELGPVYDFQRN